MVPWYGLVTRFLYDLEMGLSLLASSIVSGQLSVNGRTLKASAGGFDVVDCIHLFRPEEMLWPSVVLVTLTSARSCVRVED